MKILPVKVHGVIDGAMVLLFFSAPALFGFAGKAEAISHAMAWTYLGFALLTAYPFGILKMIPFAAHGGFEFLLAIALYAMPWIAGFQAIGTAKDFFILAGTMLFLVWLLTEYAPHDGPSPHVKTRGASDRLIDVAR